MTFSALGPCLPRVPLAVIILNYGTSDLVVDCLSALAPEVEGTARCAVVVDNASPDDSVEKIESAIKAHGWASWVQLVRSARNDGFSAGNNQGFEAVAADAYLLLNSDTLVRPGALDRLEELLHRGRGLAAPCLEWPDGTAQANLRRWATPASELARAAATGPISRWLGREPVSLAELSAPPPAQWASGACLGIHRDVIERLGGLDEGFFMYFEDMDYCRRALEAGFRLAFDPEARVVHFKGGTSPVQSQTAARARRPAYYYAARARYFAKHHGYAGLLAANLCFALGRAIARMREIFGAKQPHLCAQEHSDTWSHMRTALEAWRPDGGRTD